MVLGTCRECGTSTSSMSYKLCKECAAKKQVCGLCQKSITTGEYLCDSCKSKAVPM
ncbi:MAG: hypothetical protein ACFFBD_10005 [Candidatus Hodarchaeota archaeon]